MIIRQLHDAGGDRWHWRVVHIEPGEPMQVLAYGVAEGRNAALEDVYDAEYATSPAAVWADT